MSVMTTAPERQKRPYARRNPPANRLVLNEFQSDIVLVSMRNEVKRIQADRSAPESLRMLAIRELNSVIEQMGEPPIGSNGGSET